jgi:uncharacterized protein YidB (DUF937 family)
VLFSRKLKLNHSKTNFMLEQLINSLKSEVGGKIASQSNLPAGHTDQIFSIISNVAKTEVAKQMLSGNLSDVMSLFSKSQNSNGANQLQSNISSGVISELTRKMGLSPAIASGIASKVLPGLIEKITNHNSTTPDDDPSPLHDLFGSGGNSGILGTAKNLLGGLLK